MCHFSVIRITLLGAAGVSRWLWGRPASSQRLPRSSARLTGRTGGGGPRCIFCCSSCICDTRGTADFQRTRDSVANNIPRIKGYLPAELWFCCGRSPGIRPSLVRFLAGPDQPERCCRRTMPVTPSSPGGICVEQEWRSRRWGDGMDRTSENRDGAVTRIV